MTIRFTKRQTETGIQLTRNCQIANFDPKKNSGNTNKLLFNFASCSDAVCNIGNVQEKLIQALTGGHIGYACDDPDDLFTLTEKDLEEAHKRFLENDRYLFGDITVKEFRYDAYAGIANITTDKGDVLRIDLHTEAEKRDGVDSSKNLVLPASANNNPAQPAAPSRPSAPATTRIPDAIRQPEPYKIPDIFGFFKIQSFTPEAPKTAPKTKDTRYAVPETPIDRATGEGYIARANNPAQFRNIPQNYDPYIRKVARNTGLSEYFIRHLLSTESFIPKAKNIGDGVLTIGFGHTNHADHNTNFKKDDPITLEKAFEWFEQDIKDSESYARKYFTPTEGEYRGKFRYDDFSQSFKEALIDIAYNRGTKVMASDSIYNSLRANFRDGADNMPAAAVRTRQETFRDKNFEGGLRKRNVYRFLVAIRSLSGEYRLAAMRRFDRDEYDNNGNFVKSYFTTTKEMLSASAARQLQADWDAARRAAEYDAQRGR